MNAVNISNESMEETLDFLTDIKDEIYSLNSDIVNELETNRNELCNSIDEMTKAIDNLTKLISRTF